MNERIQVVALECIRIIYFVCSTKKPMLVFLNANVTRSYGEKLNTAREKGVRILLGSSPLVVWGDWFNWIAYIA